MLSIADTRIAKAILATDDAKIAVSDVNALFNLFNRYGIVVSREGDLETIKLDDPLLNELNKKLFRLRKIGMA